MSTRDGFLDTTAPPSVPSTKVAPFAPDLQILEAQQYFCPGCGEPLVMRVLLEIIGELGIANSSLGAIGIGCYTGMTDMMDIDVIATLHGRAPSVATGMKRMLPDRFVFTIQGDGDMVNEGLQEVLHTAARGESITCILLNNGVFGETGGQMTATTVPGQRTKTSLEGRDSSYHGWPIPIADLIARLEGVAYVARTGVHTASSIAKTKRMLRKAIELQLDGAGFTFVEVLTMCPTGWFVPTGEGPTYMEESMASALGLGELKG